MTVLWLIFLLYRQIISAPIAPVVVNCKDVFSAVAVHHGQDVICWKKVKPSLTLGGERGGLW